MRLLTFFTSERTFHLDIMKVALDGIPTAANPSSTKRAKAKHDATRTAFQVGFVVVYAMLLNDPSVSTILIWSQPIIVPFTLNSQGCLEPQ